MSIPILQTIKQYADFLLFFCLVTVMFCLAFVMNEDTSIVLATENDEGVRERTVLSSIPEETNLFFTSVDIPSLLVAQVETTTARSANAMTTTRLVSWDDGVGKQGRAAKANRGKSRNSAGRLVPSPDGKWLAAQMHFDVAPVGWVLDLQNRQKPVLTRLTAKGLGRFLAWHPDSQHALYLATQGVQETGLWLVNVVDGTHKVIHIPQLAAPEGLLAAAYSPDGSKLVYAHSKGMGFGSEIWVVNADGSEAKRIVRDEVTIVSHLAWSPDGEKIAFVKIVDSPVPFSDGGLWAVNRDGAEAKFLAMIDGGRGQHPLWSNDSQYLYYIVRDNTDQREADYETELLISSVRAVNVKSGQETVLVSADGARQLDLSLGNNGQLLFASNRASLTARQATSAPKAPLEIWQVSVADKQLQQLTHDGESKRHPLAMTFAKDSNNEIYLPLITE